MSQDQIARRLGVSQPTVSGWELGRRSIPGPRLAEIGALLGVDPDTLTREMEFRVLPGGDEPIVRGRAPREPTDRRRPGQVDPSVFRALRDERALTNAQVAEALKAAGMGHSLSRVTELTSTRGASEETLRRFRDALDAWLAEKRG
jgi:transcriptional regulator with XRE-family HTH domain